MNRLTDRSKEIPLPCADNSVFWARVHEKLARYEDSGLEPEEIKRSDALLRGFIDLSRRHARTLPWIERLMIADREGRLVVLPRNVDDVVYIVDRLGVLNGENQLLLSFTSEDAEKALEGMNNDER